MKQVMAPAYLGIGLPNAYAPQFWAAFNNGYPTFTAAMWTGYTNQGCQWWAQKVAIWNSQLPIANPYHSQLKLAKIAFAQHMHVLCGCPGPPPSITGGGSQSKLAEPDEEQRTRINKLVDEVFVEYEKFDK